MSENGLYLVHLSSSRWHLSSRVSSYALVSPMLPLVQFQWLPDSNSPQLVLQSSSVEFSSLAQRWLHLGTRESPLCAPPRLSVFCTRVATFGAAGSWACWSGGQWPGPVRSCRRRTLSRGPTGKRWFAVLGFVPAGIWQSQSLPPTDCMFDGMTL